MTVDESRERLADKVLGRLGHNGLIQAPCTARVLESALLLALLTRENLPGQEEARRFLKMALDNIEVDELQQAFAHAALGEVVDGEAMMRRALSSFRHFSSPRKLVTFQVLLAELGAAEMPRDVPTFDPADQPAWLRMQLAAVTALAGRDADPAALEPALRPGPVWQANYLAQLMALFALRRRRPSEVREALRRIEQLPGGGLPFTTGLDVFATAVAGIALARIRPEDPRVARMADALAERQQPDGGFGFTDGVTQTDVDDTTYTVEFLRAVNRHADTVAAAERFLLSKRNTDGGFPTFYRGAPSEVAMTAGVVNALAPNANCREAVEQGIEFIVRQGHVVERSWSRNATNVLFRMSLAAESARPWIRRYLADSQTLDGGWGHEPGDASDPISTAYAVIALAPSSARNRALAFLEQHQRPDGGYLSRPDQAGPRPLLYDTPALADVTVLLALSTI